VLPAAVAAFLFVLVLAAGIARAQEEPQPANQRGPAMAAGEDGIEVHRHAPNAGDQVMIGAAIVILCFLSGFCLLTLLVLYLPDVTHRLVAEASGSFLKRFLVGAFNTGFLLLLGAITRWTLGIFIIPFLVLCGVGGLLVLCDDAGRRLQLAADAEWNRLRRMGAGWTVIYFACWFPYFGWFVVTPIVLLTAAGTSYLWLFRKRAAAAAPASVGAPAPDPTAPGAAAPPKA